MSKFAVAMEIKNQLGNEALMLMGAYHLAADEKTLSFKIKGCRKIKHISIALNSMDTYDVKFTTWRKYDVKVVAELPNIYNDQLHEVIERQTGLYLSLVPKASG